MRPRTSPRSPQSHVDALFAITELGDDWLLRLWSTASGLVVFCRFYAKFWQSTAWLQRNGHRSDREGARVATSQWDEPELVHACQLLGGASCLRDRAAILSPGAHR